MRHLRVVNDVLRELEGTAYRPALQVARLVPAGPQGAKRAVQARRLDPAVLDEILNIERPSNSVDGLYARIAATLEREASSQPLWQAIRSIMADGLDHFETFSNIKEWLSQHANPETYLLPLSDPQATPAHRDLQARYREVLDA